MILLGSLSVKEKQFTMADSEGTVYAKQMGLPDNFYGGYVKEFRKTKYGIYICVNRKGQAVNLCYTEESLTDEGRELLFGEVTVQEPMPEPTPEPAESFLAMEDVPVQKLIVEKKKDSVSQVKNNKPKVHRY